MFPVMEMYLVLQQKWDVIIKLQLNLVGKSKKHSLIKYQDFIG